MKIRTDFVTNSSSSSYVFIHLESEKLLEILNKYRDVLDENFDETIFSDKGFELTEEFEAAYRNIFVPDKKENIVSNLIEFISDWYEYCNMESDEQVEALCEALEDNKAEILSTLTRVDWEQSYSDSEEGEKEEAHFMLDGDQVTYKHE